MSSSLRILPTQPNSLLPCHILYSSGVNSNPNTTSEYRMARSRSLAALAAAPSSDDSNNGIASDAPAAPPNVRIMARRLIEFPTTLVASFISSASFPLI